MKVVFFEAAVFDSILEQWKSGMMEKRDDYCGVIHQ